MRGTGSSEPMGWCLTGGSHKGAWRPKLMLTDVREWFTQRGWRERKAFTGRGSRTDGALQARRKHEESWCKPMWLQHHIQKWGLRAEVSSGIVQAELRTRLGQERAWDAGDDTAGQYGASGSQGHKVGRPPLDPWSQDTASAVNPAFSTDLTFTSSLPSWKDSSGFSPSLSCFPSPSA